MSEFDYNFIIKTDGHVLDPYTVTDKLGRGGFASVKEVKFKGINAYKFAMKSMK